VCLGLTGVVTKITDEGGVPVALIDTGLASTGRASPGTGALARACLLTCPDAAVGDTVLIHAGYVLRRLDETATQEVIR